MSELRPTCPAADVIAPPARGRAILCNIMRLDRDAEDGIGLTADATARARESFDGVLLYEEHDPSSVHRLCCGTGLPAVSEGQRRPRWEPMQHTFCPLWQAAKEANWKGRGNRLFDAPEPDSYATDAEGNPIDPFADDSFEFGGEDPDVALDPVEGTKLLRE